MRPMTAPHMLLTETRSVTGHEILYMRKTYLCEGLGRSAIRRFQCAIEAIDQPVLSVGLAHEANRSSFHRALPGSFLGKCRDENDGHAITIGEQPASQFRSAQPRHIEVRDET